MATNKYHQDGVPVEKYKFDKEADMATQSEVNAGVMYDTNGEVVKPTADAQKARYRARVAAQMKSHKNPKNRGY